MATIDDEIDRLYQGSLDAFTDARNALAKSARRADVKTLLKPSLPAWAVNQLFWHHRPVVARLEAAADAVREQHQRALAGEAADIRDTERVHREALRDASATARDVLTHDGHAITASTLDAVRDTLQALPAPEANGRLVRPLAPRGLEALAGLVMAARPSPAPVATRGAEPAVANDLSAPRREEARAAEKAAREREARRQAGVAALVEAREGLARADAAVEQAERDLARRQAERIAAQEDVKRAQRLVEELSFGR